MEEKLTLGDREVVVRYTTDPPAKEPLCLPFLSFKERVAGMLICTAVGWYLQWGSLTRLLRSIREWDPAAFAVSYSVGNLASLAGSLFLVSFAEQLHSALAPERRVESCAFFGSLLLSLLCPALFSGGLARLVTLLAVVTQIVAYWAYFLSYFPRARQALGQCCGGCVSLLRGAAGR